MQMSFMNLKKFTILISNQLTFSSRNFTFSIEYQFNKIITFKTRHFDKPKFHCNSANYFFK